MYDKGGGIRNGGLVVFKKYFWDRLIECVEWIFLDEREREGGVRDDIGVFNFRGRTVGDVIYNWSDVGERVGLVRGWYVWFWTC